MQPTTATKPNPDQITALIHVETGDKPGVGREGTFTSPPPKISVTVGDKIKWQITGGQTFQLDFSSYKPGPPSPFAQNPITDSAFHDVVNPGEFHYSVSVTETATGKKWEIKHCPEVGVGN